MSPVLNRSESVTFTSPAGENLYHLSKNKMHCAKFYRPKESFEKMSWHSSNLVFMKQFSLVNKQHCVYTHNDDH